jgi:uroporphyrinogen decarboxylase
MLTHRERVSLALRHQPVDRVPMDLGGRIAGIRHEAYERLVRLLGMGYPAEGVKICPFLTAQEPDLRVLDRLGTDFYWLNVRGPEYVSIRQIDRQTYINEWGIAVKKVGNYAQRVSYPLGNADRTALENYDWPDAAAEQRYEGIREYAKHLFRRTDFALALNPLSGGLFEMAQHLRGMASFFEDLMLNRDFAHALLDKVLDVQMAMTARYLEEVGPFVEVVALSDDYASAERLLISPSLFGEYFLPRYKKFIGMIKSRTEGKAKLLLHSCGAVFDLVEKFIEMGVDILNPLQPTAKGMDPRRLKNTFGRRLCFHGGIDSQFILAEGSPEKVSRHAKEVEEVLGVGGGYILAPSHHIQYHVPAENIIALYDTGRNLSSAKLNTPGEQNARKGAQP